MTKRYLNQNDKYVNDLINSIEPDFIFSAKPINRFKNNAEKYGFKKDDVLVFKIGQISKLKEIINK